MAPSQSPPVILPFTSRKKSAINSVGFKARTQFSSAGSVFPDVNTLQKKLGVWDPLLLDVGITGVLSKTSPCPLCALFKWLLFVIKCDRTLSWEQDFPVPSRVPRSHGKSSPRCGPLTTRHQPALGVCGGRGGQWQETVTVQSLCLISPSLHPKHRGRGHQIL